MSDFIQLEMKISGVLYECMFVQGESNKDHPINKLDILILKKRC